MKATKIRDSKSQIPTTETILKLERMLKAGFITAGFITAVDTLTRTSIKIGLHMSSFRIDTVKLGHNADYSRYAAEKCKAGYKRTDTPTWAQREQFNHIVNDCFDRLGLSANIRSGDFTIREYSFGRKNNWSSFASHWGERAMEIRSLKQNNIDNGRITRASNGKRRHLVAV